MAFILRNKLALAIFFYLLWGIVLFCHILNISEESAEIINWVCSGMILIFWLIIISDIFQNKLENKVFWILSMFLLPFFAPIVYIFRRNKILIK